MELLERESALAALHARWREAGAGSGHVLWLAGEAGIGKTSLLRALAADCGRARIWWGACDALQTPHPLAPLHDIARDGQPAWRALLADGAARSALFEAVLDDLRGASLPTLLVLEDLHWADDATLDLLLFLGRRIAGASCLILGSFRDDELPLNHPLRRVLAGLPADCHSRLSLSPLTPQAVAELARRALRSPQGLHAATQGNPFLVTELLRQGSEQVPHSVQALVLSRLTRLSAPAQRVVKLAAIVPARIERELVDALLQPEVEALEECLNSGLLGNTDGALAFRHELARVAVERALPAPLAESLHSQLLRALQARPEASLARRVHHAIHARDSAAVQQLAPRAGAQARERGAHREAAAQYRNALRFAQDDGQRCQWLAAYAAECQLTDQLDEALSAREQLRSLLHTAGDVQGEAANLSQLALVHVLALRNTEADAASRAALALAEGLPPSVTLAGCYRVEAQLRMLNRDCEAAVSWADKAIALARAHDGREVLAAATGTLGTALMFIDYEAGCARLHEALQLALSEGLHLIAANSYSNLGSGSGEVMRLPEARAHLRAAIAFAREHEIDFYHHYALAWLALCELHLGHGDAAGELAHEALRQASKRSTSRVMALVALGRLRARRGDPGAAELLDEALLLAEASGTLQRLAPVRAARAEAAWLEGDLKRAAQEARAVLPLAIRQKHPWFVGELSSWLQAAGEPVEIPDICAKPYALSLSVSWCEAAARWEALACPYEQARALALGDADAQREALERFEALGARAMVRTLRARMQAAGMRGVPRGRRASTLGNPHELTAREIETLCLLCEGLRNAEIAERLCRSVRTVDHHLAAIYGKLGVATRAEAVAKAAKVLPKNG